VVKLKESKRGEINPRTSRFLDVFSTLSHMKIMMINAKINMEQQRQRRREKKATPECTTTALEKNYDLASFKMTVVNDY
jgi:hypothetical protein